MPAALLEYRAMRWIACFCLLLVLTGLPVYAQDTADSELTLRAYMIYDIDAETIVAVHNRQQQQPIASLTKLMTAVLACERLRFDGRYILSAEEREIYGVDTMRADKMLEMALIPSNNRVCKIIARYAAGDEDSFAQAMNAKARELGMVNTRFANASGLPGGEQYSTMDDLLILARVAMLYPSIRRVVHQKQVELGGQTYDGTLKPLYDRHTGLLGGKTGYTRAAGRCLILYYNANGRNYIVITLGSDGVQDGFRDAEIVLKKNGLYAGEVGTWD